MIRGALERAAAMGTWLMASAFVIGYLIPPLAAACRDLILPAIIVILTIAMLRLDVARLRGYIRRPGAMGLIVSVNLIAAPVLMWFLLTPIDMPDGLRQGMVLLAAAPMVSSAIAFATILGLDSALTVAVMVTSYAVVPITLPVLSLWLLDLDLGVGFFELFGRLFATIAVPATLAFVIRRWICSPQTMAKNGRALDGMSVLFVMVFGFGIVHGLPEFTAARPDYVLLVLAASFAANIGLQILGASLFVWMGRQEALTVGLVTGNTNLGLIMVTLADRAPPELVVCFVLGQVPMYFLPVVALPVYRRLMRT
ncbi:MAG: BASS family bile acid:Na+ symporter [Alphaproteobacteria bacterium]|jgi:BASS family bile acid:Na+ symporter